MIRRPIAEGWGPGLFLPWPDWMMLGRVEIRQRSRVVDPELWHREPVMLYSVRLSPGGPDIARCAEFDAASRVAQEARGWDFAGEDEPVYMVRHPDGNPDFQSSRWVDVQTVYRCWWVGSPPSDTGSVSYQFRYMDLAEYVHRKREGYPV